MANPDQHVRCWNSRFNTLASIPLTKSYIISRISINWLLPEVFVTKRPNNFDAQWHSLLSFVTEFKEESDRAAVILGAAKLDALLQQILDRYLRPSLSNSDELLEGDSPLSTFSSRINACYRLGLITPEFAKALHSIRRIRNSFAHELSGASLASGPQYDRLNSLLLPFRPLHFFHEFREEVFGAESTPSADFKVCLALLAGRLAALLAAVVPVDSSNAADAIVAEWSQETPPVSALSPAQAQSAAGT
jgi:hypothetical protein